MAILTAQRSTIDLLMDYASLAKPRTVLLHLVTAAAAMFLAAGGMPSTTILVLTLAGGGLAAASANALNCYLDRDLDRAMSRTRQRPLPAGRLTPWQALGFAIVTGFLGIVMLGRLVSVAAAALAFAALAGYVLGYTAWLKRRRLWGTVIGSTAGALPPLIGWVAIAGRLDTTALLLSAIIWLWTPPHFWALAILRRSEYASNGLDPLPPGNAATWIMACSGLLFCATLFLVPVAGLGIVYFAVALPFGLGFVALSARFRGERTSLVARQLHRYSILYALALFAAMAADRLFPLFPW